MAQFLLTLIFSKPSAAASATGLFTADNPTGNRSKVWYTIPSTANWPDPAVGQAQQVPQSANLANWGTPTADHSPLGCHIGDGVYIQMVPDSSWGSDSLLLRFTSVFGRTATSPGNPNAATLASPFVLNGMPCTLYTTDQPTNTLPDYTSAGPDGSWIYYLGLVTQNAAGGGQGSSPCFYSFIAGATVYDTSNEVTYTFGHDPQMDVSPG